jgi:hypothetical protein
MKGAEMHKPRCAGNCGIPGGCERTITIADPGLERRGNHWNGGGDLVIEEKTLMRPVGWRGQSGRFYAVGDSITTADEPGGFSLVYEQIATWVEGEGWHD